MDGDTADEATFVNQSRSPAVWLVDAVKSRSRGPRWTPLELATAGIVAAIALYGGTSLIAVLADDAFSGIQVGSASVMIAATAWADPLVVISLLAASAIAWHVNAEWREDLEILEELLEVEPSSEDESDSTPDEAVARIARTWNRSNLCLSISAITGVAALVEFSAVARAQVPRYGASGWTAVGVTAGSSLAVLCASGVSVAIACRTQKEVEPLLRSQTTRSETVPSHQLSPTMNRAPILRSPFSPWCPLPLLG